MFDSHQSLATLLSSLGMALNGAAALINVCFGLQILDADRGSVLNAV
jgi:hypothetical protein